MLKFILWVLAIIIGYKLVKIIKSDLKTNKKTKTLPSPMEDVLLQDPYCKTYFPKNQGVVAYIHQKEIYFCCTECKKAFKNQLTTPK